MMQFKSDVEVRFEFMGNKKNSLYQGYRPAHMVKENYLTTGVHKYYNMENLEGEIKGTITFISPEDYPASLWKGKKIEMYEGSQLIGYVTILQIFNPVLEKE